MLSKFIRKVITNHAITIDSSIVLYIVLIFYILVAFKSSGYHHEDEHYQIIEFANYKLGLINNNRLPWEFNAEIRSGFQPFLCFVFLKCLIFFGVNNGYTQTFILRTITGLFSVLAIRFFITTYQNIIIPKLRPWYIIMSFGLWFIPYINVRFSSETYSGISILLILIFVYQHNYKTSFINLILIGATFALSILFRYQTSLFVIGVFLWMIIIQRISFREILIISISAILIMCIGIGCDIWLYGHFTFSIFNYFFINIIENVASNFGISPWYEYILYLLIAPGPWGFFISFAIVYVLFIKPKCVIIWGFLPFLVIHSFIPHKELRFLFPIANLVPLLLIYAYQHLPKYDFIRSNFKFVNFVAFVLILLNIPGLIAIANTGAGTKRTAVTEYIHKKYLKHDLGIIIIGDINPYMDWGPPKNTFYSSEGYDIIWYENIWKLPSKTKGKYKSNILIMADSEITGPKTLQLLNKLHLTKVYQNIPDLVKLIYKFYNVELLNYGISVYEFDKK